MSQEKSKSLYYQLKQKEGEGPKAGEFMPAMDDLIILERFGFKKKKKSR